MTQFESLSTLQTPEEYRASRATAFPSEQSLQWFMRQHRAELVDAGAVSYPTGRALIVPHPFDSVVRRVGDERAKRFVRGRIGGGRTE
jgi:hypothetical protein